MTQKIAIVPYGLGIGDLVNMRPIAEAVRRAFPGGVVSMVIPAAFGWLLPPDVGALHRVRGLAAWQRPDARGTVARATSRLAVGDLAPVVRRFPTSGVAKMLTYDLRLHGADRVINLLEAFSHLDLDRRWTPGPWNADRRHVIDLLAMRLECEAIPLPMHERTPSLTVPATPPATRPSVILNPCAGSSLKEPPLRLWIEVARGLKTRGITPLIVVTPGRRASQNLARAVPGCGLLASKNLEQVTRWIAGADVVVSPDTGLLHLAGAVGTRYVGLFGSTDPLFLGPYNRAQGTILESEWTHTPVCRQCWTSQILPGGRCPLYAPHTCLAGIPAQRVLDAIDAQLEGRLHLKVQASRVIACGGPHEESPSSIEQGAG